MDMPERIWAQLTGMDWGDWDANEADMKGGTEYVPATALAEKDARIAELEAALREIQQAAEKAIDLADADDLSVMAAQDVIGWIFSTAAAVPGSKP